MYKILKFFFWRSNRYELIRPINMLLIRMMSRITVNLIKMQPLVKDVYLRGSFGLKYFIPFYSDLDFLIVFKTRPQDEFRSLKSAISYLIKVKRWNPFWIWYHTAIVLDEELVVLKKLWYLYDTQPWRPTGRKKVAADNGFAGIKLKLLLTSLWFKQIIWHKKLMYDLVNVDSDSYVFYPKLRKIKSITERLAYFIQLPREEIKLEEYVCWQESLSPKDIRDNFNPGILDGLRLELAADTLFLTEKSARSLLNRYPQSEKPEFIEEPTEAETDPDVVGLFRNLALPYTQLIFSGYRGIYIVLKENIAREEVDKILKIIGSSEQKNKYTFYLYTLPMYTLSLMPWPVKYIYRSKDSTNLDLPAFFLKEYHIFELFHHIFHLQFCFWYRDWQDRLYNLFWNFLKIRLALEKSYLCRSRRTITRCCQENSFLFKDYNQIFWRVLESESAVSREANAEQIFNINLNLSRDILQFLRNRP